MVDYTYQAKLEDVTPHTFRHTFCKNAIDMGIPIDQVAMMAGHSSLDVTKRYTVPLRGRFTECRGAISGSKKLKPTTVGCLEISV